MEHEAFLQNCSHKSHLGKKKFNLQEKGMKSVMEQGRLHGIYRLIESHQSFSYFFFYTVTNSPLLKECRFGLEIREKFLTVRVMRPWHRLLREAEDPPPSLAVPHFHHWFGGHGGELLKCDG